MFQFADANSPYAPRLLEHNRFKADTDAIPKTDPDRLASPIRDIHNRYDWLVTRRVLAPDTIYTSAMVLPKTAGPEQESTTLEALPKPTQTQQFGTDAVIHGYRIENRS